ncbi:MAG: lytic murein transglycosylase B [Gammaproteobacteria bacterium]|jgi:membrane-bound lytic murein transglycosylase B|nr:MAG: lytic murein transglycosylase B [Gammaproteobacteria bacterium]
MLRFAVNVIFLLLTILPITAAAAALDRPEAQAFIRDMVKRHGFAEAELKDIFTRAEIVGSILEAIAKPAEKKPWHQYRPIFLTPDRVSRGVKFWEEHAEPLARAEALFGVPAEIIVAIIGVETSYGRITGRYKVINALSTLAFAYPPRAGFFTGELEQYLLLCRERDVDPHSLTGSYAGAMGLPQFMPSSFRNYAVDFDRDGVIDLAGNRADAIGSVGNYFKAYGWIPGAPITRPVDVKGKDYRRFLSAGIEPDSTAGALERRGLAIGALPAETRVKLLEFENQDRPEYWLGFQNFYVISRYNNSMLYSMAVYQLAGEIHDRYTRK